MTNQKGEALVSKLITILDSDHKIYGDEIHHNGEFLKITPLTGHQGFPLRGVNVLFSCGNTLKLEQSFFYNLNGEVLRFTDESNKCLFEKIDQKFGFSQKSKQNSQLKLYSSVKNMKYSSRRIAS